MLGNEALPIDVVTPTREAGQELARVLPRYPDLQKDTWMVFHFETTDFSQVVSTIREGCAAVYGGRKKPSIERALARIETTKKCNFNFKSWQEKKEDMVAQFFYLEQIGASDSKGGASLKPAKFDEFCQAVQEYIVMRSEETNATRDPESKYQFFVTYGSECILPVGLRQHVKVITYEPLKKPYIRLLLRAAFDHEQNVIIKNSGEAAKMGEANWIDDDLEWYADQMAGVSEQDARRLLHEVMRRMSLERKPGDRSIAEKTIVSFKNNYLAQSGTMKAQVATTGSKNEGQEKLGAWITNHKQFVRDPEKAPKGIALVGLPGTGKSAAAKTAAKEFELPLVKFELASILGHRVGDSEKGMDRFLTDLKYAAPCVLWIDEVEKTMGGVSNNGGSGDSNGVMDRLFGALLTFMQENDRPVFMVVTANNITKIPPEFFRSGRFDMVYALMLPSYKGCVDIMNAKLQKYAGTESIDIAKNLMQCCVGTEEHPRFLTGADIEARVKELCIRSQGELSADNMRKISQSMRVLAEGDSHFSMQQCAQSYLYMIQNGMYMAGDGDTLYRSDNMDLDSARFYKYHEANPCGPTCFKERPNAGETGASPDKWYDRVLFEKLEEHICDNIIMDGQTPQETKSEYFKWKISQRSKVK